MNVSKSWVFPVLVGTATVTGFAFTMLVNWIHDLPEVVDWCFAASAGYLAAEFVELKFYRPRTKSEARK